MVSALCALTLLLSQQLCAAESLIQKESSETPASHQHSSHDHSGHDANHQHDNGHQHDDKSNDECCKNQPPLALSLGNGFITKMLVADLAPVMLLLNSIFVVSNSFPSVSLHIEDPPPRSLTNIYLLSLSLAPNAPPSFSSI